MCVPLCQMPTSPRRPVISLLQIKTHFICGRPNKRGWFSLKINPEAIYMEHRDRACVRPCHRWQ